MKALLDCKVVGLPLLVIRVLNFGFDSLESHNFVNEQVIDLLLCFFALLL